MYTITFHGLKGPPILLYTQVHCEEKKKRTVAYYNLFPSNLQHNLLKFKSLKFKRLKIAEGNDKDFACVWVPLPRLPLLSLRPAFLSHLKS